MPLVNMQDMLQHAYRYGYAVGAFGVAGWDILEGVVEAAETLRAPVILSLSKSYPGTDNIESLALAVVDRAQRATVPGRKLREEPRGREADRIDREEERSHSFAARAGLAASAGRRHRPDSGKPADHSSRRERSGNGDRDLQRGSCAH